MNYILRDSSVRIKQFYKYKRNRKLWIINKIKILFIDAVIRQSVLKSCSFILEKNSSALFLRRVSY